MILTALSRPDESGPRRGMCRRAGDRAANRRIDTGASSSQLLRQAEGHVVERGLRGAVGREMRVWRDSVSRRDLDQTIKKHGYHDLSPESGSHQLRWSEDGLAPSRDN
jgi:hypothetical protein